jgi:hypothetical protein
MNRPNLKSNKKPENTIRDNIKKKLQSYGWHVFITHGNEFQMGFPDLYCIHPTYGYRWIEVKRPTGYAFTDAQQRVFPLFQSCKIGIWILTSDDDKEIDKLFQPANWWTFLSVFK